MKPLYYLPIGIFLLLAVALAIGLTLRPSEIPSNLVGKPAPEFQLEGLYEGSGGLGTADMKDGRMKLLNVFGSWCEPCRVEHPILMALKSQGVPIYALNYKDENRAAKAFLENLGNPFSKIGVDQDGRVAIDFGLSGVPETYVINAEGMILYQHIGPLNTDSVRKIILPLLKEGEKK